MQDEERSASVTVESDGMKISVTITGPDAVKECERLLDKLLDWVDDGDDDED